MATSTANTQPKFLKALVVGQQVCPGVSERKDLYQALKDAGWYWSASRHEWNEKVPPQPKPKSAQEPQPKVGDYLGKSLFRIRYRGDRQYAPLWTGECDLRKALSQARSLSLISFVFDNVLYISNKKGTWHIWSDKRNLLVG